MHVGIWRPGWTRFVSDAELAGATRSDYFDIVATRSRSLFSEITEILGAPVDSPPGVC